VKDWHLIVFPPFSGGHHLGNLISTAFIDYSVTEVERIYNLSKNNVDGSGRKYHDLNVLRLSHFKNLKTAFTDSDRAVLGTCNLIILSYPEKNDSFMFSRITNYCAYNVSVESQYTYQSIREKLPEFEFNTDYTTIPCDYLENSSVGDILLKLPLLPYKHDICQLMHDRWLQMISKNLPAATKF
jgi:hypothetical protein